MKANSALKVEATNSRPAVSSLDQLETRCKICWQLCPKEFFCNCRGDLTCHRQCLQAFLRSQGSSHRNNCQICTRPYHMSVTWQRKCAPQKFKDNFLKKKFQTTMALAFIVMSFIFIAYYIAMLELDMISEQDSIRTIFLILLVICCIFIVSILIRLSISLCTESTPTIQLESVNRVGDESQAEIVQVIER